MRVGYVWQNSDITYSIGPMTKEKRNLDSTRFLIEILSGETGYTQAQKYLKI